MQYRQNRIIGALVPVASRRIYRQSYALMSGTAHWRESQDGSYRFGVWGREEQGGIAAC